MRSLVSKRINAERIDYYRFLNKLLLNSYFWILKKTIWKLYLFCSFRSINQCLCFESTSKHVIVSKYEFLPEGNFKTVLLTKENSSGLFNQSLYKGPMAKFTRQLKWGIVQSKLRHVTVGLRLRLWSRVDWVSSWYQTRSNETT